MGEPCPEVVVGLDGAYVRARHQRPERNFELIVGKVLDGMGHTTRFAPVRNGGSETVEATRLALRQHGVREGTVVTVLTDGDGGLRTIQRHVAPQAKHVLDWFHISMKFENLMQLAKGINGLTEGAIRSHVLGKLGCALLDIVRYLETNADSLPNYGQRYREGRRISTGFAESAVNEIIAKRMTKNQQMRWNRYTVQSFLNVRVHVLNCKLENAFRHCHRGFRPQVELSDLAVAA